MGRGALWQLNVSVTPNAAAKMMTVTFSTQRLNADSTVAPTKRVISKVINFSAFAITVRQKNSLFSSLSAFFFFPFSCDVRTIVHPVTVIVSRLFQSSIVFI